MKCERGHRVVSSVPVPVPVPVPCDCGGHDRYVCRMRVGNRSCGWSILLPVPNDRCGDDDK